MTIPQLEAVLRRLGRHVNLKLGIPMPEDEADASGGVPKPSGKTSSVTDLQSLASLFGGLG